MCSMFLTVALIPFSTLSWVITFMKGYAKASLCHYAHCHLTHLEDLLQTTQSGWLN